MNTSFTEHLAALKNNSEFTGSISMGRDGESIVGTNSVAAGYATEATGAYSAALGFKVKATAGCANAEGANTLAAGYSSHAEGRGDATTTHLENNQTYVGTGAYGPYSHSEGSYTWSIGENSHAEGLSTLATGDNSHAEGSSSQASGYSSHAEGLHTIASGSHSHSEGSRTVANHKAQHVFGEYNIADTFGSEPEFRGTYVEIVGNGTSSSARSNARTLDWNGNEVLTGKLTVGAAPTNDMDVTTKKYVDDAVESVDSNCAHVETVSRSKTRTGNPIQIEDAVNEIADKTVIKLEPKQDLHGFSKPWVGGAGKNLLGATLSAAKTINTNGTWSGNEYTINGIKFTCHTSENGYITKIVATGSSSSNAAPIMIGGIALTSGTSYTLNGCPSGGGANTYCLMLNAQAAQGSGNIGGAYDYGSGVSYTETTSSTRGVQVVVRANQSNVNLTFYPMVRLSSVTDATWEPFENICPISGYDTVTVKRTNKNLINLEDLKLVPVNDEGTERYGLYISQPGTYACHCEKRTPSGHYANAKIIAADGSFQSQTTFGSPEFDNVTYLKTIDNGEKLLVFVNSSNLDAVKSVFLTAMAQVELGSVATAYEEIQGAVYPISVSTAVNGNTSAGTVYSGTVTLNADGSGTVVVDRKCIDLGDYTWTYASSQHRFYISPADAVFSGNSEVSNIICSKYGVTTFGSVTNEREDKVIAGSTTAGGTYLTVRDTDYSDATVFKTAVTGTQVVYPLATPVTYILTANQVQTLLGYNYIYTDGAEIALTYRQESLATNETLLKLLPTGTASGNPVNFSDGADGVPLKQLVVNVEPNQDLHGYEKPWVGGAGKNLLDPSTRINNANIESNGTITISTANVQYSIICAKVTQGTNYVISNETGGNVNGYCVAFYSNKPVANSVSYNSGRSVSSSSKTFTAPITGWVAVRVGATDLDPQLEVGTTASAFEPYENICPIRGWDEVPLLQTGKNLIAITATSGTVSNVAVTVNNDGTVKLHGTANSDGTITLASGISTKGGEVYTLTGCPSEGVYNSTYWLNYFGNGIDEDGNDVFLSTYSAGGVSGGISSEYDLTGTVSIKFKNGTVFDNIVFSPMLYNTSLSSDFEPGFKKTYSIALPSEAGTVYGGMITLDENGEGELVVNSAYAVIGKSDNIIRNADRVFTIPETALPGILHQFTVEGLYCDKLLCATGNIQDNRVYIDDTTTGLRIRTSGYYSTSALMLESFGGSIGFAYPLATPITHALTADQVKTLLGTNIISSDAGTCEVEYFKALGEEQDLTPYAPKANPEFSGSIGLYRKSGTTVGVNSMAIGTETEASGFCSQAVGYNTIANGYCQNVSGVYNISDRKIESHDDTKTYGSGYCVYTTYRYRDDNIWWYGKKVFICKAYHSGDTPGTYGDLPSSHWDLVYNAGEQTGSYPTLPFDTAHVEIVGIGRSNYLKNGRTLDWSGNEEIAGAFKCQNKITIGNTTITESQLQSLLAMLT